jgi:sugar phosphate isomerase/epimerase
MGEVKFACAAWGFREMTLPEYFAAADDIGLEFVEVNVSPNTPKHLTYESTDDEVKQMVDDAEAAGVQVVALAGGNDFASPNVEDEIEKVKRQIDMTRLAGAEVLRIFAGWVGAPQYTDATFARVVSALMEVGEYGAAKGVCVAVENHGGITATGAQCRRLLEIPVESMPDALVSLPLGLNFDPANFRHAGEDALSALLVTSDLINYSHWKDVLYEGDKPEYCAVGEGVIDWGPVVRTLLESGFNGYWAIEYENVADVVRGTRDSVDYLKTLV